MTKTYSGKKLLALVLSLAMVLSMFSVAGTITAYADPVADTYTVTWKNGDIVLETDDNVAEGTVPEYDGEIPEKSDEGGYIFTFFGWSDGENTYAADELPAVTANVTYTATFSSSLIVASITDGETITNYTSFDDAMVAWNSAANGAVLKLMDDMTTETSVTVSGTKTLDLNGHTIRYTGTNGSVIEINNANTILTVDDSGTTGTITGGNTTGNGGGVKITAGTFELKNGIIEGNTASNGGGVSLENSGRFNMSGGIIRYNCGYVHTGGVLVVNNNNFTMTGGVIQYNVGKNFGGIGIASSQPNMCGTAVVKDNVIFSDVTQTNTKITETDGVYTLAEGGIPCDVKDSTANGLKIKIAGELESGAQIGIFYNGQTSAFTNGYKTNNPDDDPADYFFSNESNYLIKSGIDGEAQILMNGSPVARVTSGEISMEYASLSEAVAAWSSGTTLTLLADVTSSSSINNTDSGTKTIDLNGYGIRITGNDKAFNVNGNLIINDSDPTKAHAITLNNYRGTAVADGTGTTSVTNGTGTVYISGGYITGGYSDWGGAAVLNAELTINGGTIVGNISNKSGAIRVNSNGILNLNGGHIIYNRGISNADNGGAINEEVNGKIRFSGNAVVKNNYDNEGFERNVNLRSDLSTMPKVTAPLTDGAEIGITMQTVGVFTSSENTGFNDPSKFTSDDNYREVIKNDDGQLELKQIFKVTIGDYKNGTVTATPDSAYAGTAVTVTAVPNEGGCILNGIKAYSHSSGKQTVTLTALNGTRTGNEGYDKLVDRNVNTKWGSDTSGYIIVKADKAILLTDFYLTTANDTASYSGRNWKNWEIYGANFSDDSKAVRDSAQWNLVASVTDDTKLTAVNYTQFHYKVDNAPDEYRYYRIELLTNQSGSGMSQMSELSMEGLVYDSEVALAQDGSDETKYTFDLPVSDVLVKAEFFAPGNVTWTNWDGTILETDENEDAGSTPSYDGEIPVREENEGFTFEFGSWTPELSPVNGDITYTAVYDGTPKQHDHDELAFVPWDSDNSMPSEAGNYFLIFDITLSNTWTVPSGTTNLCLNGHTIRYAGSNGTVIQINNSNAKLTLYDCGTTGTITGGNYNGEGGGVKITAGTFEMKNGIIEGNVANNGAGVSVSNSGYFIMTGGTVQYNCGYEYTGGVLVTNNNFTMSGGTIQYNVGKNYGGIGIAGSQPNMTGTPVVKDNVIFSDVSSTNTKIIRTDSGYTLAEGGTPCNVKHATSNGLKINITGELKSGAQIGIFDNSQTAAFTNGYKNYNTEDPSEFFTPDDTIGNVVTKDEDGEAILEILTSIASYDQGIGSGEMEPQEVQRGKSFSMPVCTFTSPGETKHFAGWLSSADNKLYQAGDTVAITADTTFTAQWMMGIVYQFDFEQGMPYDWHKSINWYELITGDHHGGSAHSGSSNLLYYASSYNNSGQLLTTRFDLTGAEVATIGFWYTNRSWSGDVDQLVVSYRIGDGDWVELFATDRNHELWTNKTISLPAEAFAENVQFRFGVNGHYGYGVAIDDMEVIILKRSYVITWDNQGDVTSEELFVNTIPSFGGEQLKPEDNDDFIYIFAGWNDGENTYTDPLPAVSCDTTYTAIITSIERHELVEELINALPAKADVTTIDEDKINEAREAYNALVDSQKEKIDNDTLAKLTDAEAGLSDAKAAAPVAELINALPAKTDISTSDEPKINEAREAYDALTDDEKAHIDNDTLTKLTDSEEMLVDVKILAAIEEMLNNLGQIELTDECEQKLKEAREAYDELRDDLKAQVTNRNVLKYAEDLFEALKAKKSSDEAAAAAQAAKESADEAAAAAQAAQATAEAAQAEAEARAQAAEDAKESADEAAAVAQAAQATAETAQAEAEARAQAAEDAKESADEAAAAAQAAQATAEAAQAAAEAAQATAEAAQAAAERQHRQQQRQHRQQQRQRRQQPKQEHRQPKMHRQQPRQHRQRQRQHRQKPKQEHRQPKMQRNPQTKQLKQQKTKQRQQRKQRNPQTKRLKQQKTKQRQQRKPRNRQTKQLKQQKTKRRQQRKQLKQQKIGQKQPRKQ